MISPEPTRALVLGGGGLAGIAWEVGVLVGLADAGLDVTGADRVVGTSAGSVVGALVTTGVDLAEVHARHRDVDAMTADAGPPVELDMEALGQEFAAAASGAADVREMRARIGSVALRVETVPEAQRREVIAARLPVSTWPERDLRIAAVEASSGELVVFERGSDVELVDAVAASCAVPGVWPPVTIDGHRYVDGGVSSVVHVDLADRPDPVDRILVIAPLDPPPGGPFMSVGSEVTARRSAHPHAPILALLADEESLTAFGGNVLDPTAMPPSAAAGRAQGRAAAEEVARLWT